MKYKVTLIEIVTIVRYKDIFVRQSHIVMVNTEIYKVQTVRYESYCEI